jgi:hypothetical protein
MCISFKELHVGEMEKNNSSKIILKTGKFQSRSEVAKSLLCKNAFCHTFNFPVEPGKTNINSVTKLAT